MLAELQKDKTQSGLQTEFQNTNHLQIGMEYLRRIGYAECWRRKIKDIDRWRLLS